MSIRFGPGVCGDLGAATTREWLVADGLGGYAMGTVAGLRTRRYHGLLVMATDGPSERMLALAALDPVLLLGDARIRLGTHEWAGGVVDPRGCELLSSFELDRGVPRWRWQVGDVVLERELAMAHGRPVVGIVHRLVRTDRPVRLELTPLCTWRNVHGERFADGEPVVEPTADGFVFERAFRVVGTGWCPGGGWYRGVRVREEAARGLNDQEDMWAAGRFAVELAVDEPHGIVALAVAVSDDTSATELVTAAKRRADDLVRCAQSTDATCAQLVLAADQFVIESDGVTAVAGYPWFGEWSRDLMTSFDGLFLVTGRAEEGRRVLERAAATLSEGMLANTADTGALEYNTADGTLWFVHALGRYVAMSGDVALGRELGSTLDAIVTAHIAGTRFGIVVDPADGLLRQGADDLALTWMDARVDGSPVTPRAGKAVEINALWINALELVDRLLGTDRWSDLCGRARRAFEARFVRNDGNGLLDVVDGPRGDDWAVRPNQLLAVALPHGPLAGERERHTARAVVDACRGSLLTPLGLRSLSPDDPAYEGRHRGSPAERDAAYHEGTVWPWLIGPYVDAADRVGVSTVGVLDGLEAHLPEWGVGSISETAEGTPPHRATGCPFQAWSVAEVLRVSHHGDGARAR